MSNEYGWYQTLDKPSWAPPSWLFNPVWSLLYGVIIVSFGMVFYMTATKQIPRSVAVPFALNLVYNFAFTPLQFGLRNNLLAAIDMFLVVGTLVWALFAIWPYARWITYANVPYLLWIVYATVLQLTITALNW